MPSQSNQIAENAEDTRDARNKQEFHSDSAKIYGKTDTIVFSSSNYIICDLKLITAWGSN